MAILSNLNRKNTVSLLDGGGGSTNKTTPTYGNWLQNLLNGQKSGSSGSSSGNSFWQNLFGGNNQNPTTVGASGQKQTMEFQVGRDEPVKETLPAQAGQSAEKTLLSDTGASAGSGTGAATEQKTYSGAWAGSEPIDSYEEFLRNKETAYGSMRDEQTQFYDEQSQKALAAIEEQRQAAIAEANNQKTMTDNAATEQKNAALAEAQAQKDLLINMSEEQKNAVYAFAEEQRISDMNYAAQQYQILLDSINAQKESGMAMATEQRDLLLSMSEEQRAAAYKYAEEQRASATAHANSQYQTLVDAINAQKESGMAMAEEQRQLLLSMSEEQRNAIYAAAESQRVAAEQRADVERERGVVDARSSYEQNKASYGANAEAMGSMGLAGSGYSDYLNSKAYAQQRAETQAANAQADASKREARYTEDQARLQADSDYYQNKYNAEQAYSDRKYEIDTTYQTNMLNAEQNKAQSIYEAESAERDAKYSADSAHAQNEYSAESQYSQNKYEVDTTYQNNLLGANQSKAQAEHEATSAERETKFNADQAHAQNEYAAESGYSQSKYEAESAERDAKLQSGLSYSENLFNAESQARSDKLTAEQTADAGKFSAEMSYQENLLNNDDAIGKHRLEQEQKAELEAEQAKAEEEAKVAQEQADYETLLAAANSGTYTKEQLEQLAKDKGLSEEHTNSVLGAADKHTEKVNAGIKVDIDNNYAQGGDTQDYIDEVENAGGLTPEEAQDERRDVYLKDIDTYGTVDMDELKEDLATGKVSQTGYNDIIKKNETAVLKSAKSYISSGGTSSAIALAEEQYSSDAISQSVYQQVYHEIGVAAAKGVTVDNVKNLVKELELWKNSGKISASDYYSLSKYYYGQLGTTVSATESGYKANEKKAGQKWQTFTWNGTNYWADSKENTDTDLKNLLNGIATGKEDRSPNIGTLVRYNGKTYAYVNHVVEYGFLNMKTKNVTEWTEIHDNYGNDDYGAQIEAHAKVNETPAPTHSNNQWSSYEDAAADGYSNIMTRTEWARRKSSTGCNTYQEYLDKMYAKYIG